MKKARTLAVAQGQRYPGCHIEVWHKSSETFQSKESLCSTPGQANTAAGYDFAQNLPPCISPTPNIGVSTTQETPESTIIPIYNGWSPYQAKYFEQGTQRAQNSVCFQSLPVATTLSLPTHSSTPSTNFSNTTNERYNQTCSETSSLSATRVDHSLEAGHLLESQDTSHPKQREGIDLCNNLLTCTQTYENPTFDLVGFPHPELSFLTWTTPIGIVMGGGQQFPTSHQVAAFSSPVVVSRPKGDYQQPLLYHGSWDIQQSALTPMPNCLDWTNAEIPAQPFLQQTSINHTPLSQPLRQDELCLNDAPYEDQMSHNDQLPLRPRQLQPNSPPAVAGVREEILTVSEDSQGTAECTCETQPPNTPCSSCTTSSSLQSWVMVTYELVKPSDRGESEKKPPKLRKRLDEDARRQTSQTREVGACSYRFSPSTNPHSSCFKIFQGASLWNP